MNKYSVVFIDDATNLVTSHEGHLLDRCYKRGVNLVTFSDYSGLIKAIEEWDKEKLGIPVLAIVDMWLEDKDKSVPYRMGGIDVLRALKKINERVYFVIYSAHITDRPDDPYRMALTQFSLKTIIKKEPRNVATLLDTLSKALDDMGFSATPEIT